MNYNYITDAKQYYHYKLNVNAYHYKLKANFYHYKLNVNADKCNKRALVSQIQEPKDNLTPRLQRIRKQLSTEYSASCMKHNYNDLAVLAELVYVDSMQNLKDAGNRKPGLDALCAELKIERNTFCTMKSEEMLQNPYGSTFIDIISYLNA